MSAEIINQTGFISQSPVSQKSSFVELSSDFSLPDYQPEIRRLLSTRVNVLPPSEYIGNDNAEFSGEIIYRILYTGNDGGLYSASMTDTYTFSSPLEYGAKNPSPDDVLATGYAHAESVVARVLAPRKLNLRCKLSTDAEVLSPAVCYPRSNSGAGEQMQNLIAEAPVRKIKKLMGEPVALSDFIALDSPLESARIVDFSSSALITECTPAAGSVSCRGEVWLKILYCNDSESDQALTLMRKMPFSVLLDDSETDASFECRANAYISGEMLEIEENGINCELFVTVCAEAQKNEQFSYIKDSYSTERKCECYYQTLELPLSVKCANGNISQSNAVKLADARISPDAKIVDAVGSATVRETAFDSGKMILKGECGYTVICSLNDEYSAHDLSLPFKYELDCRNAPTSDPKWNAEATVLSTRARADGEKLFIDSEIALSVRVSAMGKVETLCEIELGEEIEKRESEIVVCYPDKSDTLWSVAKRYAEPTSRIKLKNAISENDQTLKKKYLII